VLLFVLRRRLAIGAEYFLFPERVLNLRSAAAFPDVFVGVEVPGFEMILLCAQFVGEKGIVAPVDLPNMSAEILLASALRQYRSNYIYRERRPTRRIRFWLPTALNIAEVPEFMS
jgi:hypothetical protein